jgi:NADPH-dependent curcumin reductase CurA
MTDYTIPATGKEVRLVSYPDGDVRADDFTVIDAAVAEPGDGEVLVRNEWQSLGTGARELLVQDTTVPLPTFKIGEPMWGRMVGTVVKSNSPALAVGDLVENFYGWREYATGPAESFLRRDRGQLPSAEYFLSNGPTAWLGMADMAGVGEGDVVFVSGASSGVGSLAGLIAKARGAKKVIGSAGSKAKCDYLVNELGFDAAFDYHDGPVIEQLAALAPEGITVFFDNVGGEQFEAAVLLAAPFARFALCGALSGQLGVGDGAQPRLNLLAAIPKQLQLRPFACYHTPDQLDGWNKQFGEWLSEGKISFPHTVVEGGVAALPETFVALLNRKYSGTTVIRL